MASPPIGECVLVGNGTIMNETGRWVPHAATLEVINGDDCGNSIDRVGEQVKW